MTTQDAESDATLCAAFYLKLLAEGVEPVHAVQLACSYIGVHVVAGYKNEDEDDVLPEDEPWRGTQN